MALTETVTQNRIQIIGPTRSVHIKYNVVVENDGEYVASNNKTVILNPGTLDENNDFVDTDLSAETTEIQSICAAVWTDEIKEAWKQELINALPTPPVAEV